MDFVEPARPMALELVGGRGHYERVVRAVMEARRSVWIATANLKELMVEDTRAAPGRRRTTAHGGAAGARSTGRSWTCSTSSPGAASSCASCTRARRRGRSAPRSASKPRLARGALALRACPRVHFKIVVVDGAFVYVGSANWTGAGLGAKGTGRRNFELGFAGRDDGLLDRAQELYDRVWRGGGLQGLQAARRLPRARSTVRPRPDRPPRERSDRPGLAQACTANGRA